ncbi:MAG: TIGR00730 family Rossman fold protein [Verrucomicrobiales bacterium]|jgi:uncharacterized protein (TIGR00730 family)|nr:TIGR00730 family Rossman fold protein [Verrucomicrobiales bacterium]
MVIFLFTGFIISGRLLARMKSILVFCGSSSGEDEIYHQEAVRLGGILAQRRIDLIYGGGRVGLMGAVADAALANGGKVIGVIPRFMSSREIAHYDVSELILVDTMHQRKARMHELCDGVIALPGGYGTLEELFEILTWGQLGQHRKPVALLNVNGFYDPLLAFIQSMVDQQFLKPANRDMLLVDDDIDRLLRRMEDYSAPPEPKWIVK